MEKREVESAIKEVYQELRALLSLYVETEGFNKVPEGEKTAEGSEEDDAIKYLEGKIAEIRKRVESLFPGEGDSPKKLNQIIDETEYFIMQCEVPGVVTRWKQINPRLIYFDCAFEIMEESPELYLEMRRGLMDVRLSCYPDSELVALRNAYFAKARRDYERNNLEYSEEKVFQDELLKTLTLLFQEDFKMG